MPIMSSNADNIFYAQTIPNPTVTKLCHNKCNHPACVSADGGHFEHYDENWVVALNMA